MALSRKPKTIKNNKVQEDKITELIMKGGSVPTDISHDISQKEEYSEEVIKFVQLRIPEKQVRVIDKLVKKRPGKLSRHTWIMEAIAEKIKRDTN